MTESNELLSEYARNQTESAFRELVGRYFDLVYSTALRRVGGDRHLAEDVAQTVFLHLANKARKLPKTIMLGGWLHAATCNVAGTVTRSERRRVAREKEAVQMNTLENDSTSLLAQVAPVLDEAIGQLPREDRTAVLLRFFERRDFRSVGEALGSSEDAARMRVNRALQRLGLLLKQRGVAVSAATLATLLGSEAVIAAPTGMAASVAASALAGVTVASGTALSIFKTMSISKLQMGAISALVIGGLTTLLVRQHHVLNQVRNENRALQQQAQDLREAQSQLAKAQVDQQELENLRRNERELLRLRGEVASLRKAAKGSSIAAQNPHPSTESNSTVETPGVLTLQGGVQSQVATGQTLVTGGWSSQPGIRTLVLATPSIQGDNADQVLIQTKVAQIADSALTRLGLGNLTVREGETLPQQLLSAEQIKQLLQELDTNSISAANVTTLDGRQATIGVLEDHVVNGTKQTLGPSLDILPSITPDKSGVALTLQADIKMLAPTNH